MLRMASRVCWNCNQTARMALLPDSISVERVENQPTLWRVMGAYRCDGCGWHSIGFSGVQVTYSEDTPSKQENYEALTTNVLEWHPEYPKRRSFPHVPKHIASAASEAFECHSIGAHRAAGSMARSVIEATAKDKGITKGNLQSKIDEMEKQSLVRPLIKDAAHEVRHLGNDIAHGDFIDPVTKEETAEVLELMAEILNEVYQAPAKIAKRQAARTAKVQSGGGPQVQAAD